MYCIKLTLRPTAAMTFRVMPGSILNIATYPFVPPTTFAGFLRRLGMLSVGLDLPDTDINKKNPPIYSLPPHYISLGAYVSQGTKRGIHRTYRKGMRSFKHDSFSRIYQGKSENFQLHTWEYLIAEELIGYVVADSPNGLKHIQGLESYGCKIGKEGFAYVSEVSEVLELELKTLTARPSTVVPADSIIETNSFIGGCDIYNLYRYQQSTAPSEDISTTPEFGFLDTRPSSIDGFTPFVAAYYGSNSEAPELDYYTCSDDIYVPASLVTLLQGRDI